MKNFFTQKTVAIAAGLFLAQSAFAQTTVGDPATYNIYGNNDSSNHAGEGVFITSNAGSGAVPNDQSYIVLKTDGTAQMGSRGGSGTVITSFVEVGSNRVLIDGGVAEITVDDIVSINTNTSVNGTLAVTGATALSSTLGVTGNTSIGGALVVTGLSTTTGITNSGALIQTGVTSINVSGNAATTLGVSGNTTNLNSSTNNIGTGSYATSNTIGSTQATNVITGATNSLFSTGINTIAAGTGNSITTTTGDNSLIATAGANNLTAFTANNIQGPVNNIGTNSVSANNIGTGAFATTNTMGSNLATNVIRGADNSILSLGLNTISAATNNISATVANNIQGPVNNIGTDRVSVNNMGTGEFQSTNLIGNTVAGTTVTATAVNASQALAEGTANTKVISGASRLTARVDAPNVATTGQVLLSNTAGTTVNANGKIVASGAADYVNPVAPTAAVTLTNGYGNTHGLVVTESQTTLSGGTESSSLTLTDRAATFSNAQNGAPITVTGVADGRGDFDAVNVRQFAGAIAAVAAQANIPALAAGQDRTFGMGVGNFMGKSALAMGLSMRGGANSVYKATVSSGLNNGMKQTVVGVGGAWGF